MLQTTKRIAQGQGLAPVLLKRASTVALDWDLRQKSRFDCTDSLGRALGVFLPLGTLVRGGDVLVAEDGSMVRVIAAPQALLRVTACTSHGTAFDLIRAAYYLGRCHVPVELKPDHLKIERDQVQADMLRAMHLIVDATEETFEPEGAAYSADAHSHDDAHEYSLAPAPVAKTVHVHSPDCNHGHDHAHDHPKDVEPVSIQIHQHKPHSH
jgi:urease accessory protein